MKSIESKESSPLVVYSKNNCPQCDIVKSAFRRNGVVFDEVNIDENDDAKTWLLNKGHRAVPQIYRGDECVLPRGYHDVVGKHADFFEMIKN